MIGMLENWSRGGPCYVISDPALEDNPIVFVSHGFSKLTGYKESEILGRNCRFLQGKETNPEDVEAIRNAIADKKAVSVRLKNYRKDGSSFDNQFFICPLFETNGDVAYFLGVQTDAAGNSNRSSNPGYKAFKYLKHSISSQLFPSVEEPLLPTGNVVHDDPLVRAALNEDVVVEAEEEMTQLQEETEDKTECCGSG